MEQQQQQSQALIAVLQEFAEKKYTEAPEKCTSHLNSCPPLGDTWRIHFCQWNAVKALSCRDKIQSELPHPLNIKHNSLNRL